MMRTGRRKEGPHASGEDPRGEPVRAKGIDSAGQGGLVSGSVLWFGADHVRGGREEARLPEGTSGHGGLGRERLPPKKASRRSLLPAKGSTAEEICPRPLGEYEARSGLTRKGMGRGRERRLGEAILRRDTPLTPKGNRN